MSAPDLPTSLLLVDSLEQVQAEKRLSPQSLKSHLIKLCEALDLQATEEEADRAVALCLARLTPRELTPKEKAWRLRLQAWQAQGRQWVASVAQAPALPAVVRADLDEAARDQRPSDEAAWRAQRAGWEKESQRLDVHESPGWVKRAHEIGGLVGFALLGSAVSAISWAVEPSGNVVGQSAWILGPFIGLAWASWRRACWAKVRQRRTWLSNQLARHRAAQAGRDHDAFDVQTWSQNPSTQMLWATIQASSVPLLRRDVEDLNATINAARYQAFSQQQDRDHALQRQRARTWATSDQGAWIGL